MTNTNPPAAALESASLSVRHLPIGDVQRDAVDELIANITQALESACSLDRGMRLTSGRLIGDVNFLLDSLTSAATRLAMVAETIEAETDSDDVMPLRGAL